MAAPTATATGQVVSPILAIDIMGTEVQEKIIGGLFFPQNTSAPTENKVQGNYIWNVSRTGVGVFQVTILATTGFVIGPFLPAVQNPSPKNIQVTLCIDPAGTQQNLNATAGPVTRKANSVSFSIFVFSNSAGTASDITQPGSPTDNGSFVMWRYHYTELRNPPR
jgi:hypothetical protein